MTLYSRICSCCQYQPLYQMKVKKMPALIDVTSKKIICILLQGFQFHIHPIMFFIQIELDMA